MALNMDWLKHTTLVEDDLLPTLWQQLIDELDNITNPDFFKNSANMQNQYSPPLTALFAESTELTALQTANAVLKVGVQQIIYNNNLFLPALSIMLLFPSTDAFNTYIKRPNITGIALKMEAFETNMLIQNCSKASIGGSGNQNPFLQPLNTIVESPTVWGYQNLLLMSSSLVPAYLALPESQQTGRAILYQFVGIKLAENIARAFSLEDENDAIPAD